MSDKPSAFFHLEPAHQHYDWGTKSDIAKIFKWQTQDDKPLAELWMGSHPKAPSKIQLENGEWIELNKWLKKHASDLEEAKLINNGQLGFLFKVLSAAKALSIQVHPNKVQAELGFEKEEAEALKDRNALDRNYRDANHKPELICALSPFVAMSGFRNFASITTLLRPLQTDWVDKWLLKCSKHDDGNAVGIKEGFIELLSLSNEEKADRFNSLVKACRKVIGITPSELDLEQYKNQSVLSPYMECLLMAHDYPNDIGIISPFLMHLFWLDIGQAIFLEAGIPHAYLRGTGLEIMAASDNVLRGGLTSKHIDLRELKSVMTAGPHHIELVKATYLDNQTLVYDVGINDFKLIIKDFEVSVSSNVLNTETLSLVLCLEGELQFIHKEKKLGLKAGDASLLTKGFVNVNGAGRLAIATNG